MWRLVVALSACFGAESFKQSSLKVGEQCVKNDECVAGARCNAGVCESTDDSPLPGVTGATNSTSAGDESDAEFCARLARCGEVSDLTINGSMRTTQCGCATGCCQQGSCVSGNTTGACGASGACEVCDATRPSCLSSGHCGCFDSSECVSPLICNDGVCTSTCDADAPCTTGCCKDGACVAGNSQNACGLSGVACATCAATGATSTCVSGSFCGCATQADCANGQACLGGVCSATCTAGAACKGACCSLVGPTGHCELSGPSAATSFACGDPGTLCANCGNNPGGTACVVFDNTYDPPTLACGCVGDASCRVDATRGLCYEDAYGSYCGCRTDNDCPGATQCASDGNCRTDCYVVNEGAGTNTCKAGHYCIVYDPSNGGVGNCQIAAPTTGCVVNKNGYNGHEGINRCGAYGANCVACGGAGAYCLELPFPSGTTGGTCETP